MKLTIISPTLRSLNGVVVKEENTPGTAGGPGGRDQTLAVKSLKKNKKSIF